MNTAETLTDADGDVYPHNAQGAGSIRIMKAIKADSLVAPGSYSYGTFMKDKGNETKKKPLQLKTNRPSENHISSSTLSTARALPFRAQTGS